jgi:hypothetical protein
MPGIIEQIVDSKLKPKEKLARLAGEIGKGEVSIADVIAGFEQGKDPVKGLCMEALELVSQDKPSLVAPQLEFVIGQLGYKAPRVKWEAAQVIGNLAKTYPDKVLNAIPALFKNATDPGTVVRWSAAFALCEIAKSDKKSQTSLIPKLAAIEKKEKNNGVKKIYSKTLKKLAT